MLGGLGVVFLALCCASFFASCCSRFDTMPSLKVDLDLDALDCWRWFADFFDFLVIFFPICSSEPKANVETRARIQLAVFNRTSHLSIIYRSKLKLFRVLVLMFRAAHEILEFAFSPGHISDSTVSVSRPARAPSPVHQCIPTSLCNFRS